MKTDEGIHKNVCFGGSSVSVITFFAYSVYFRKRGNPDFRDGGYRKADYEGVIYGNAAGV